MTTKPHHLSFDPHRCRGGGYYFNSPTRAGVLFYLQKGVSSDNPEHAFILWLIKIAAVTFTVHAVMTDYLLREFFFSLFIEISSRILFPCISSRWSKCLYILYYFYLSLTTHPIELEGVHILTKAHERAPVCWCFPPPLGSPMCVPLLTAVHDQICL